MFVVFVSELLRKESGEAGMNSDDILSVLCGQNSAIISSFNPKVLEFRNKVIELQKDCPMIEWEHDMGATIPFCKLDNSFCNGQCYFKANDKEANKTMDKIEQIEEERFVETDCHHIINDLETVKIILCKPEMLSPEMCIKIGQVITSAVNLLKEQEVRELTMDEWREWKNNPKRDPICELWENDISPMWILNPNKVHEPALLMGKLKLFTGKPTFEQCKEIKWK